MYNIQWTMYMYLYTNTNSILCKYMYIYISVFNKLIWCTFGPKSSLFGSAQLSLWASGTVNYDYIVTNSINSLLIGSKCFPNGAHTNHF